MQYMADANPAEVRASLQNYYDRYRLGVDRFPKARPLTGPEDFPRKTQQVARLLIGAWDIIDQDRDYFGDSLKMLFQEVAEKPAGHRGMVITKIGLNAIMFAQITAGEPPEVVYGDYWREEFVREMNGRDFQLADGRVLSIRDGQLVGDTPDYLVPRQGNTAAAFVTGPQSANGNRPL